jgi:hypothetical protein
MMDVSRDSKETSTKLLTFLKWGRVTCLSRETFKCGGLLSEDSSLEHYEAAPMVAWVTSLSVGLGSTFDLVDSRAA